MKLFSRTWALSILAGVSLAFCGAASEAAVRGKALLVDAPSRVKPGNLVLCTLNGDERKFDTLVEGEVVDACFSPDGKSVVFGIGKSVKTMDLATRKVTEIGDFGGDLTYFNWCQDNTICFADGDKLREVVSIDLATRQRKVIYKAAQGRTTVSLDGKRMAWVLPPVAAFIDGKVFRYTGGCGGAVSPSGKYLTSNLTTTHRLIGIYEFTEDGPSKNPVATVVSPKGYAINGFHFGRSDDWVCFTVEGPKEASPHAYLTYWRTNDFVDVGKYCIKDFFDETDVLPADTELESITLCTLGPTDTPLTHEIVNVGLPREFKVVGHFKGKDGSVYTPQIRDGVTWKVDPAKVEMTATAITGKDVGERVKVTADYKGKSSSFEVTVLPKLTGDGFKAEFFADPAFGEKVFTRFDDYLDFRWDGSASPNPAVNGRKPWSARWTGKVEVQTEGEYTFYFLQGEGNDRFFTASDGKKVPSYEVQIDGQQVLAITKSWNYPWADAKASSPIKLTKGMHTITVTTIDASAHPVVVKLLWSGPGIKQTLLGGPQVHSGMTEAEKKAAEQPAEPEKK